MAIREAWIATVQHGDDPTDQETELVTIEREGDFGPPIIELTDGTRIQCVEPAGEKAA